MRDSVIRMTGWPHRNPFRGSPSSTQGRHNHCAQSSSDAANPDYRYGAQRIRDPHRGIREIQRVQSVIGEALRWRGFNGLGQREIVQAASKTPDRTQIAAKQCDCQCIGQ